MDWFTVGTAIGLVALGAYNGLISRVTHKAVKPNGESVAQMVKDLKGHIDYDHRRNHDILNSNQRIEAALLLTLAGEKAPSVRAASALVDEVVRRWKEETPPAP